jgi:hypothetical protein
MKSRSRKPKVDPWEYTLTWPLWPETSYALLEILRRHTMLYLEYVTHDLCEEDPDKAAKEIQRAANRLKEIVALLPGAVDATIVVHCPAHRLSRIQSDWEADL